MAKKKIAKKIAKKIPKIPKIPAKKKASKKKYPRAAKKTALARQSAPSAVAPSRPPRAQPPAPSTSADSGLSRGGGLTTRQRKALLAPWNEFDIRLRPDGVVYVPNDKVIRRLNHVIGPMLWGRRPVGEPTHDADLMVHRWELLVNGAVVGNALGECTWRPSNKQMTRADAIEGCRSNALSRICKELMNNDHYDARFAYSFRMNFGVLVNYRNWRGQQVGWRHYDDPPLENEYGIDDQSPNRDRYKKPPTAPERAAARPRSQPMREESSEAPAPSSRATPKSSSGHDPITGPAVGQLDKLMKVHGVSAEDMRAHLQAVHGIEHRNQIRKRDFNRVSDWVKRGGVAVAQPAAKTEPVYDANSGEIREGESNVIDVTPEPAGNPDDVKIPGWE